jgi:glycosyltransferase involved in cell wall biosynthesis
MVPTARRPTMAILTMSQWGPAYPRIARWLGSGLRLIGAAADIVFLDGSGGVVVDGSTRIVHLGAHRAQSSVRPLRRYLEEAAPDVVLAIPHSIAMVAVVAGRPTRRAVVPWFVTVPRLDSRDVPLRLRPLRFIAPVLFRNCPRIAAVSAGVRDALLRDFPRHGSPERIVVLPTPLDGDEIRQLASPAASRPDVLRICSVGRLSHAKGFDTLVAALAKTRLDMPWEALIVGEGPLREELARQVHGADLDDHVRLVGHVDNPYPLMSSADIGVQPSRWEGFSVAMGELLALGVPLVTTDCPGGFRDIIGGAGIVIPTDDSIALGEAIARLGNNAPLRHELGALGPSRMAQYAPAVVARQVMDLVEEIVDHPRTAGRDS